MTKSRDLHDKVPKNGPTDELEEPRRKRRHASQAEYRIRITRAMQLSKAAHKNALKGFEIELTFDDTDTTATYRAGSLRRKAEVASIYLSEDPDYPQFGAEFRTVMGEVRTRSGHSFWALLSLCTTDSCEHYGTTFIALDCLGGWGLFEQGTAEFRQWAERMKEIDPTFEAVPYQYRYLDKNLRAGDHHVDTKTGWSGAGRSEWPPA